MEKKIELHKLINVCFSRKSIGIFSWGKTTKKSEKQQQQQKEMLTAVKKKEEAKMPLKKKMKIEVESLSFALIKRW